MHKSENIGYEPALVNTERGQQRIEGVRNNQRVLLTDYSLAHEMWGSLCKYAPPILGNSEAVGLNEMFRFYKYEPGQEFKKHRDQSFIRNEVEASYFTMMIYLNDGFEGGETTFDNLRIKPKKGMCLIFFHDLEHEGTKLKSGVKYVLRTDIMYKLKE
ncbi:MAG: 2OG-Fe(II) oxygenase [Bacteroidota bacterium]